MLNPERITAAHGLQRLMPPRSVALSCWVRWGSDSRRRGSGRDLSAVVHFAFHRSPLTRTGHKSPAFLHRGFIISLLCANWALTYAFLLLHTMIIPDVHRRNWGPERWNNVSKIECLKSDRAGFQAPLSPAAKSRLYSVVLTSLVHAGKSPGGFLASENLFWQAQRTWRNLRDRLLGEKPDIWQWLNPEGGQQETKASNRVDNSLQGPRLQTLKE